MYFNLNKDPYFQLLFLKLNNFDLNKFSNFHNKPNIY